MWLRNTENTCFWCDKISTLHDITKQGLFSRNLCEFVSDAEFFSEIYQILSDIQVTSGQFLASKWQLYCHMMMSRMQFIQNGFNKPSNFTSRPKNDKDVRLTLQVVISQKGMTRWRQKSRASEDITVFDHVRSS